MTIAEHGVSDESNQNVQSTPHDKLYDTKEKMWSLEMNFNRNRNI